MDTPYSPRTIARSTMIKLSHDEGGLGERRGYHGATTVGRYEL